MGGETGYSKGDTYRPVNKKKFDENYEKIFGTKDKSTKEKVEPENDK